MKITIVGAGNMGLCMLGYLANQGHDVILYTNSSKLKDKNLVLCNYERHTEEKVSGFKVSSSIEESFKDCDIVFCTYPAFLRIDFIVSIENVINKDAVLCFVPGYGGAEYLCKPMLTRGVKICGLQRVPYVARYEIRGKEVYANILSAKKILYVAAIPMSSTNDIAKTMEDLLNIPTSPLEEYLAVTMSPSNPLLHISGLYGFFGESSKDKIYDSELKFYEEWTDTTSEFLFAYDEELHRICNQLSSYFNLDEIVPLSIYYESPTPQDMTKKLKSIESFKIVKVPLKKTGEEGFVVDTDSRMFIEDFPFGVCMFKAFAIMAGVKTPVIDKLLRFYAKLANKHYFNSDDSFAEDIQETGIPQLSGIKSMGELRKFYNWI